MEIISYKVESFEGPLDLLLSLIQKNKMDIQDISISLICEQYLDYIHQAQIMDMELAGEFIVMASELMLIKSKMLLPHETEKEESDPRKELADALLRYQQAKEASGKMKPLYERYSGRFEKDTDEITIDKDYVSDQDVISLCEAVRRIIASNESRPKNEKQVFAPLVAKPIVPVDVKIVGILHRMEKKPSTSMRDLLSDATGLNDMIAIFLGILELVKVRKILLEEDDKHTRTIHGLDANFVVNPISADEEKQISLNHIHAVDDESIPLSSKAEMHKVQRRLLRDVKKRKKLLGLSDDGQDLALEEKIAKLLDSQIDESDETLFDDLELDYNQIVKELAEEAKKKESIETEGPV